MHTFNEGFILLLVGRPFKGKTVSALTFPKPLLIFDWDDGVKSAYNTIGKDGTPIISEQDKIHAIRLTRDNFFPLEFKTGQEKGASMPAYVGQSVPLIETLNLQLKALAIEGKTTIDGQTFIPKTIVFDSLTEMFRIWQEMVMYMNRRPSLTISDWGTLETLFFSQFMPTLRLVQKKIPGIFIVINTHQTVDKDEMTGRIDDIITGMSGRKAREAGKAFDEVWQQDYENGEYIWRTRQSGSLQLGTRLGTRLPEIIKPATFQTLEKIFGK